MKIEITTNVARTCIPALRRAITTAEARAELARTDAAFHAAENDMCLLDCLLKALEKATAPAVPNPAGSVGRATLAQALQNYEPAPETATCDGCENAFPVEAIEVMGEAEHGQFGYCAACRAKDAKAAEAAQEPIVARCSHCGEPEEATGPLTDAREGRQLCEDCRGELCADADYARYDD